jgi:serine/threonine protein kinase
MSGRGPTGEVWQAQGPGGTEVAFKIIRLVEQAVPVDLRLLERIKKIRHPNLVPLLALWVRDQSGQVIDRRSRELPEEQAGLSPEIIFLISGLGELNVLDRLQACQREGHTGIPCMELLGYIEDAARALDYLHTARHDLGKGPVAIRHGDVKPCNLLIVGSAVQLSDTGVTRALRGLDTTNIRWP